MQLRFEDETQEIEQQLRSEYGRDAAGIVRRRHLDEIHPDDASALRETLKYFEHFVVLEAAVTRCARPGRDRRIKPVDIDRDVIVRVARYQLEHAIRAQFSDLAHGKYLGAEFHRVVVVRAVG